MPLILGAFWISVGLLVYGYAGFPLLVAVTGRLLDRRVRKAPVTPKVSLLIAAYNEEQSIRDRIENALSCDYPGDALEIIVASDGSSDGTEEIVSRFASDRVRLLSLPRRGKAHALNEAARHSRGEILVFSDANSLFEPDALRMLVRNFADPDVGGVAGHTGYTIRGEGESVGRGEDLYWRYDSWLKGLETRTGSVIAAHGGMYAIRRELFQPLADAAVTDDFAISTGVVAQGRRLVFESEARASELTVKQSQWEFQRRIRLMTRGLRSVLLRRRLLNPWEYGFYSVALFSHKVLRRLLALVLPVLLLTSLALHARGALYFGAAAAQGLFYSLAVGGWALRSRAPGRWKVFYVPFFFCMANLASAAAIRNVIRGRRIEKWSPQRHEGQRAEEREAPARDRIARRPDAGSHPEARGTPDGRRTVFSARVCEALERAGIRYCLLRRPEDEGRRGPSALPGTLGSAAGARSPPSVRVADLLVHPADARALESALREQEFIVLPAAAPAFRSHVRGRTSRGACLQLDIRTDLMYGPGGFRTATPGFRILRRARREMGVPVLSPEDEIVDLLLHAILDVEEISSAGAASIRACVRELRRQPVLAGRAAERIQQELAPTLTWDGLLRHATVEDWTALERRRGALALRLLRSEAARSLAAGGRTALRALAAFPRLAALRGSVAGRGGEPRPASLGR